MNTWKIINLTCLELMNLKLDSQAVVFSFCIAQLGLKVRTRSLQRLGQIKSTLYTLLQETFWQEFQKWERKPLLSQHVLLTCPARRSSVSCSIFLSVSSISLFNICNNKNANNNNYVATKPKYWFFFLLYLISSPHFHAQHVRSYSVRCQLDDMW